MRRPARISLLAIALLAAGCSDSSGPELFGCDSFARHNIGETVTGSIRTNDCNDPESDGYVDLFQFRQAATGPVSVVIEVPEGSVPMIVAIVSSDEELIDFQEAGPGEEAAVGGILEKGTYFIVVGSEFPGATSTYSFNSAPSIRFTGPPFLNCAEAQAYTFGAIVNGTLDMGDCVVPDGAFMDRYQFTLATARTVTITQTSTDFDSYLYLFNSAGAILARNDDFGTSLDSRISISLPAGTYSIGASAFDEFEAGQYTLRAQ
jgi:hypothetical protein